MAEKMREEVKAIYEAKRSGLREKANNLRKEMRSLIDLKRNESYKEVESK